MWILLEVYEMGIFVCTIDDKNQSGRYVTNDKTGPGGKRSENANAAKNRSKTTIRYGSPLWVGNNKE